MTQFSAQFHKTEFKAEFSGGSGEKFPPKVIQVIGRIQFFSFIENEVPVSLQAIS